MLCSMWKFVIVSGSAAAMPTTVMRWWLVRANCSICGAVARQVGHQGDQNHSNSGLVPSTRVRRLTGSRLVMSFRAMLGMS